MSLVLTVVDDYLSLGLLLKDRSNNVNLTLRVSQKALGLIHGQLDVTLCDKTW